ncbi:hypothetical protein BKP37_09760 [Anaerobacillus alkalilacustris]|uniref:Uncharacterized protein n=1 Tax=Anaerobacillus alkalilacustris TaxID=393763 RepID=A0A1S2LQ95_9BACI|nr:hypothetical protein [Anaerobacillus alkalilacustris]OIJ13565.1 hypothetical protein BKP37_09760 [Anaerobacillus alkalilacustris]
MDYYALLSGLIGTIIGGLITWLNTRYSLNKQFKLQAQREELKELKDERIALNSVKKEINHNLIQLGATKKIMDVEKMEYINYKASNQNNNLKMDKWNKHSDIIESMDDFPLTTLQALYVNLSFEISNQMTDKKRTIKGIDQCLKASKDIEEYLKVYHPRQ